MADHPFLAPTDLDDAIELAGDESTLLLGGGTSLAILVRQGFLEPETLVWLGRVPQLRGIEEQDGRLRIGATTTLDELATSTLVQRHFSVVARAAGLVANPRVRSVATVAGALVHGDARQDLPPALMAADATVHVAGPDGPRAVPLRDGFFRGALETIDEDELVTHVTVPLTAASSEQYLRFNPGSKDDYPTLAVAARVATDPSGEVTDIALALAGVARVPLWVGPACGELIGRRPTTEAIDQVAALASSMTSPVDDDRGSSEYKTAMAEVFTRQILTELLRPSS